MCKWKINGESVDHLLLYCPMAWELWAMVCSLFGVHWVMPARVLDLLSCWQGSLGQHQNGVIWRAVPHCVMRCLWRERNARTFEGCERNIFDLKLLLLRTLFDWMFATGLFSFHNFLEFFDHCIVRYKFFLQVPSTRLVYLLLLFYQ